MRRATTGKPTLKQCGFGRQPVRILDNAVNTVRVVNEKRIQRMKRINQYQCDIGDIQVTKKRKIKII